MAELEINDLTSLGLIQDLEPSQLPPEAWTTALNVLFCDKNVESIPNDVEILATPTIDPLFLMQTRSAVQKWYLYASEHVVMAHDGTTEYDITGPTIPNAFVANDWFGTLIGGIPILTDGSSPLQYWPEYSGAVNLADLPGWPTNANAKVVRSLGPYVMAFNITEDGIVFPHMVWWAHPALPGEVPPNWDWENPASDSGRNDLSDVEAGVIVDALSMRNTMYIYKELSTHAMRLIGGRDIFSFEVLFETTGILAPHCVASVNKARHHLVMTQDDLMVHDGVTATSVLDNRLRKVVMAAIDSDNHGNSFVVDWPENNVALFAYPENGQEHPSRGVLWHYGENGACSEIEVDFQAATLVDLAEGDTVAWDDETVMDWDTPIDIWNKTKRRQLAVVKTQRGKIFHFAGSDTSSRAITLRRMDSPFTGRDRKGAPIVDFNRWKLLNRIWVKADGAPMTVRAGARVLPNGSVTWQDARAFDPSIEQWVDMVASGPALAYEFMSSGDFKLTGYKPIFELLGTY